MRHGLIPTLALLLAPLILGLVVGVSWAYGRGGVPESEVERRIEAYRDSIRTAEEARDSALALYEREKEAVVVAKEQAAESADSAAYWRERWAALPRWEPTDTAAILEQCPAAYEVASQAVRTCNRALGDCEDVVEAQDSALVAADSSLAATNRVLLQQAEAFEYVESELDKAQRRIRSLTRWRPVRDLGAFVAGGGVMYLACQAQ